MGNIFTDATTAIVGSSSAADAYNFWDVVERVADYLGYGAALKGDNAGDNWARVHRVIEDGYKQFLFPLMPGEKNVYQWRFLKPQTTLTLVAETWEYTLDDNFGGFIDEFIYPDGTGLRPPAPRSLERLLNLRAGSNISGDPYVYAFRPVALTASTGQRWQILFYPTPSTAHVMRYRYRVIPGKWGVAKLTQTCQVEESKGTGDTSTCSVATVTVTDTGATFQSWGVAAGDPFVITDGTANAGTYEVTSVTDETHLVLTASAGTGTASYVVGESHVTITGTGSYTTAAIAAGDKVVLSGKTGPTEGVYTVSTKDSATRVTLTESAEASGEMTAEFYPATAYHYGGMPHSRTVLEACLYQAELQISDMGNGPHYNAWIAELARSLAIDREMGPNILGYNGDNSDGVAVGGVVARSLIHDDETIATF